jgi:hypothetical protein
MYGGVGFGSTMGETFTMASIEYLLIAAREPFARASRVSMFSGEGQRIL